MLEFKGYRFKSGDIPTSPRKKLSDRANHLGKRFGRAVVIEFLGNERRGYKWWGLICDCGTKFAARSRELTDGDTKSCGCLQRDNARKQGGLNKLPMGIASRNELYMSYIKSAKMRGLEFNLSIEEFEKLVTGKCAYCGVSLDKERKPNKNVNGGFFYTGIDRIDSKKGYIHGNVTSCCWICNRAKGSLTHEEFMNWIHRIIKFTNEIR